MNLLEAIQNEIKQAGGRMRLADQIVKESPNWFSLHDRRFLHRRSNEIVRNDLRRKKRSSSTSRWWTPEDTEYLLEHYGIMKHGRLANILNRDIDAIRMKFNRTASEDRKAELPEKYRSKNK